MRRLPCTTESGIPTGNGPLPVPTEMTQMIDNRLAPYGAFALRASSVFADDAAVDSSDKSFIQNSYEAGLAEINAAQLGRTVRALVDKPDVARACADAPDIDGRILLTRPAPVGEFIDVRITGAQVYDLIGEPVLAA